MQPSHSDRKLTRRSCSFDHRSLNCYLGHHSNFIKKKYIQFKKGVQDVTLRQQNEDPEDMDEVLAELEKLDNQTVLLTRYEAKQKRALVSLAVALLEDVRHPQMSSTGAIC